MRSQTLMKTVRNRCEDGSIWRGIGRRSGALLPWCDWLNTLNLEDSFAKKLALGVSMIVFWRSVPRKRFGSIGDAAFRVKQSCRALLPSDFVGLMRRSSSAMMLAARTVGDPAGSKHKGWRYSG